MTQPILTIITVTRNLIEAGRADSMTAAMEAVQAQSFRDMEHVILDGASTDGTQALIEKKIAEFSRRDAPIPILYNSAPDKSLYDAMNKAVERARGEYVVFLNSDDLLAGDTCFEDAFAMLGGARPDYVFGETIFVDEAGARKHSRRLTSKGILQSIPFCHNSTLIRRGAFEAIGGHDLQFRIVADYDMILGFILGGYHGASVNVPISVFHRGGLSADAMATSLEMIACWRKNYQPFVDMARFSDEACLEWIRIGQLPPRIPLAILKARGSDPVVRRAALHSLGKTLRRRLQPWRRWDNLGVG